MTVAELIALLKTMPQELLVVQSSDARGNNFLPVSGAGLGRYAAETPWRGKFGPYELTPDDRAQGYTEEDVPDGPPAVCIWPVNKH